MTSKLSAIGKWIGASIASVVIVAASFLGFHAFNARAHANAELQSGAQSPQSDSTEQSGPQSGDTPQSAEPTPVDVPKPTPPPHLHREGQIGAQATAQYYLELEAYAINMGDTEEYMKICDEGESCSAFDTEDNTADNPQYSTIGLSNDKTKSTRHYEEIMLLAYEGDTWVVKRVWSQRE